MNRYSYSKHHRTWAEAKLALDKLMREGAITEEDHPRIVPYSPSRNVTHFSIDLVRR